VNEIEAVEGMVSILDAPKQVNAAISTGITLDRCRFINNLKLVGARRDSQVLA
jgi:hypothetical protein